MFPCKMFLLQPDVFTAFVLNLINTHFSLVQCHFENISTITEPSFLQNGIYHKLPTVYIYSDFILSYNTTSWKISIPDNTVKDNIDSVVHIEVRATFPFYVYLDFPKKNYETNLRSSRTDADEFEIFNASSYKFLMIGYIQWSYLEANYTKNSIHFRSNEPPFFGLSVNYFLNLQTNIATFEADASIPEYFRPATKKTKMESCEAYFFLEPIQPSETGLSSEYSCVFANGNRGKALVHFHYLDWVDTSSTSKMMTNCWMRKEECGKNNSCILPQLPKIRTYFLVTSFITCKSESPNINNQKDVTSTPIFVSLFDPGQNTNPEIYFTLKDVNQSTMIHMEPFEQYQHIGSYIRVTCRVSDAYAKYPIRVGIKQKHSTNIKFSPASEFARYNSTYFWLTTKYNIQVDNLDIESVFCFAPVRGTYNWINTSRLVAVYELSSPNIITEDSSLKENIPRVERTLKIGSKKEWISCDASGFPPPRISWIRNNIPIESREEGTFPSIIRTSVLVFEKVDKATEGIYICKAQNSQGEAQLLFNVVVTDNSATILAISIAAPVIGILLISSGIIVLIWKRMKEQTLPSVFLTDREIEEFLHGSQSSNRFPNESIMKLPLNSNHIISEDSLIIDHKSVLGSGQYGLVMNGWRRADGGIQIQVAVKTTKQNTDVLHFKAFLSEVKISSYLYGHPNIVEFFGARIENIKHGEIYAAYELCKQGDLLTLLCKRKPQLQNCDFEAINDIFNETDDQIGLKNLFEWSRDIANGMEFLRHKNVIHGDLAARNVLITKTNLAKISDFGLSRQLLNDYGVYKKKTKTPLPFKWMAPESLTDSNFSLESDVWSFGVTLWEIFSLGDPPFPGRRYNAKFVKDICEGIRPKKPKFAPCWIYSIMLRCWEKDWECRPSITSIRAEIQGFLDNVQKGSQTKYAVL